MIDHEAAMNDDPILRERFLRELRHARHLVHERGDHAVVSRHEGEVSLDFSAAPPRIVAAIESIVRGLPDDFEPRSFIDAAAVAEVLARPTSSTPRPPQ